MTCDEVTMTKYRHVTMGSHIPVVSIVTKPRLKPLMWMGRCRGLKPTATPGSSFARRRAKSRSRFHSRITNNNMEIS